MTMSKVPAPRATPRKREEAKSSAGDIPKLDASKAQGDDTFITEVSSGGETDRNLDTIDFRRADEMIGQAEHDHEDTMRNIQQKADDQIAADRALFDQLEDEMAANDREKLNILKELERLKKESEEIDGEIEAGDDELDTLCVESMRSMEDASNEASDLLKEVTRRKLAEAGVE